MKILRYEEYIMEKLTHVGDFLHIDKESGIIYVDAELIGEYLSFVPQYSEIAINENPDDPELGWNYELSMGIKDKYDPEYLQNKLNILKEDFKAYIKDAIILKNVLILKFNDGLEIKTSL